MATQTKPEPRALLDALVEEISTVAGALLGAPTSVRAAIAPFLPEWVCRSAIQGERPGSIAFAISRADAARLSRLVMGFDDEPEEAAVVDMLQELAGQAIGALGQRPVAQGLSIKTGTIAAAASGLPDGAATVFQVQIGDGFEPLVGCWCELATAVAAAEPPRDVRARDAGAPAARPAEGYPANLDVILDIDLPLSVRFGEAELTLDALTKLGPGSVIDLGRSPDDPVDVLVNGRLVARAEVVVVAGSYGVRILEVVSAADRLRSLGA